MRRWHRRWRHSIRWRLVTLFLLLALATTAVFVVGMQRVVAGGWQGYVKPMLADYAERLAVEIGSPPSAERAAAIVARLPVAIRIDGPVVHYDSHPGRAAHRHDDDDEDGGFGLQRATADGHRITFGLAEPRFGSRPRALGWITLAALLALTAVAFVAVRRLLAPLQDIGAGVERFGRGEFGVPIVVPRRDELGELAERINRMAGSLQGMLDAKRALLLAISHELRSPLTRARVNAELLDETPERAALMDDLASMRDLITDLLESERLASGHAALHAEPTDVGALVRELVASQFAVRTLHVEVARDGCRWSLDAGRLRLLLRNLIGNALRHGVPADRPPDVVVQRDGASLKIVVRDHGPGVAAEHLAHLADAFYRPDSARSRASGGVGLGLHLCRLVARAHRGALVFSRAEPGLRAELTLPGPTA